MIAYFVHRMDRFAVHSAFGCMIFGSLLLILLLAWRTDAFFGLGVVFFVFVSALNVFLTISLVILILIHPKELYQHVLALVLIFSCYPVTICYLPFL